MLFGKIKLQICFLLITFVRSFATNHNKTSETILMGRLKGNTTNIRNEKDQVFVVSGWINMMWDNLYLSWNVSEHNLSYIVVKSEEIWYPNFVVRNSVNSIFGNLFDHEKYRAQLHSNGTVLYSTAGKTTTFCRLNLFFFPFDSQACYLEIFSWSYPANQLILNIFGKEVDLKNLRYNGQWLITKSKINIIDLKVNNDTYKAARITFHVTRKPLFFIMTLVIPVSIMSFLVTLAYLLPAESTEKISLIITTLLNYSVYQLSVNDKMPKTSSYVPLITIYVSYVLFFATMSLLSSISVLILHFHVQFVKPPKWLRILVFDHLSKYLKTRSRLDILKDLEDVWIKGKKSMKLKNIANARWKRTFNVFLEPLVRIRNSRKKNLEVERFDGFNHHEHKHATNINKSNIDNINIANSDEIKKRCEKCKIGNKNDIEAIYGHGKQIKKIYVDTCNPGMKNEKYYPSITTNIGHRIKKWKHYKPESTKTLENGNSVSRKKFNNLDEKLEEETTKTEWRVIVQTFDRLFFVIYFLINILASFLFFIILPLSAPREVQPVSMF